MLVLNEMREEFHRLIGIELSGIKSDRSAVAWIDCYPFAERLVLGEVSQNFSSDMDFSADQKLLQHLVALSTDVSELYGIALHGPLDLPPYLKVHNLGQKLPHPEQSSDPEVQWMNRMRAKLDPCPKGFVPYLQRPAEVWLRHMTPERYSVSDGFGANGAPMAARLQFLVPHLTQKLFEVYPRISVLRIGDALKIPKKTTLLYSDLEQGLSCREDFLARLMRAVPQLFIYERDLEQLILNLSCFHAFIAVFTLYLESRGQCVARPVDFPSTASWIHIPKRIIGWEKLFN